MSTGQSKRRFTALTMLTAAFLLCAPAASASANPTAHPAAGQQPASTQGGVYCLDTWIDNPDAYCPDLG